MTIAVASGKGGTGKTTLAVSLALSASGPVRLLDCDVEEPNCFLYLSPRNVREESVSVMIPQVNEGLCTGCGECSRFCRFNAIVALKTQPLVFPELCHGCGGCALVCPVGAISEVPRRIGTVRTGRYGDIELVSGLLDVGAAMSPPVIRAVKNAVRDDELAVIDCPPGTSCPMVTAIRGSDFVVLVTEPTPFGLHDLMLAVDTVRELDLPFGVVINRADIGDDRVVRYCRDERVPVLLSIPEDRRIAEAGSRGCPVVEAIPQMRSLFGRLLATIRERENADARI